MVAAALVATVRTQEAVAQEDEAETVVATFAVHYRVLVAVVMSRTMQRTRLFSCAWFSVLPVHEL